MRAVVTGGGGFIGSNLVDALIEIGAGVLVIDDFSTGRRRNLDSAQRQGSSCSLLTADICDRQAAQAVQEFKPTVVFHLAAQMNVRRSVKEPVFDAQKNVVGLVNMLEAARSVGTSTFIMSSTGGAIYGEQDVFPAPENHPTRPECPYGVSKRAGELYLEYYARAYQMTTIALRYANVYGPRQNPRGEAGVVAIFAERLLDNQSLVINGSGEQTRDFVYVRDVVWANLLAEEKIKEQGFFVINIGTGKETSILQLAEMLRSSWQSLNHSSALGSSIEHAPGLVGEQMRSVIDPRRAQQELGWQPRVSLNEGLEATLKSFRDIGSVQRANP